MPTAGKENATDDVTFELPGLNDGEDNGSATVALGHKGKMRGKATGGTTNRNVGSGRDAMRDDGGAEGDGRRARMTREALRDASNGAEGAEAVTEALGGATRGGAGGAGGARDLKSMRARLDAARKESARNEEVQAANAAVHAVPAVVNAGAAGVDAAGARGGVGLAPAAKPSASGALSLYRDYYENEDFIEKCERAINFRPKARQHDYKNRIEELQVAVKTSKDCLRHVFQNGANFSKELERYESNERQSYEAMSAQLEAMKTSVRYRRERCQGVASAGEEP
jgi:hypothetical protein